MPQTERWNPHIFCGQRAFGKSVTWYCQSMFRWHTDTINIWIHVLAFIVFCWTCYIGKYVVAIRTRDDADYSLNVLLMYVFSLSMCSMFGSGAIYLSLWPHSEKASTFCLRLYKISVLHAVCGTSIPFVLIMFKPQKHIMHAYWSICTICFITILIRICKGSLTTKPRFMLQLLLVLSFVSAFHGIIIYGVFGSRMLLFFKPFCQGLFIYAVGFEVRARMIPERIWPGRFDTFGNSDNINYMCIAAGAINHYLTFLETL
jgi:adiponectin receptor